MLQHPTTGESNMFCGEIRAVKTENQILEFGQVKKGLGDVR